MPYEFDEELQELIVYIRGIWKDLLFFQLELFGLFPSSAPFPLINYLGINCILQANKIQHDLLDLRLDILLEKRSILTCLTPQHYLAKSLCLSLLEE